MTKRLYYSDGVHIYDAETDQCLLCHGHYTAISFDPRHYRLVCEMARQEAEERRRGAVGVEGRIPPA